MTEIWQAFLFGFGFWLALLCVLPVIGLVAFITHKIEKRWPSFRDLG